MERAKKIIFRLLAILLPILVAEVAIRGYDFSRGASARARTYWYWAFVQDRFLGYRHRPNVDITLSTGVRITTNSDGFRDREIPIADENRRLVICAGESSTWGFNAADRDSTWPSKLQSKLQEVDKRFVVLNAAIPGYSTLENARLIQLRLLKYKPEAIVYMGFRNDFTAYGRCLDERTDVNFYGLPFANMPRTRVNDLAMRSSIVGVCATLFRKRFDQIDVFPLKYHNRTTPRAEALFRQNIAEMAKLCRGSGAKLLWVDQPIDYANKASAPRRAGFIHLRRDMHDELQANDVPLLDAHSVYDFKKFPLTDDVHFTDQGTDHLVEILAPQILAQLAAEADAEQPDTLGSR